jgi:hypothetical protein
MTGRLKSTVPTAQVLAARTAVLKALQAHVGNMDAVDVLAVLAHAVGQFMAMQDQTKHTAEALLELVASNIEAGNQEIIEELLGQTRGSA